MRNKLIINTRFCSQADHFYDLRHNAPHLWLGISLVRELCLFSWVLGWLRCSILGVYVALM